MNATRNQENLEFRTSIIKQRQTYKIMKPILSDESRRTVRRTCKWITILAGIGISAHVLLVFFLTADNGMKIACDVCVKALHNMEARTGWSYEAINVVLFIFLEPSVIGFNILLYFFYKYTFSHVLLAIESAASFLSVSYVCYYVYEAGLPLIGSGFH